MSDWTESGAVPVDDAVVEDPPTEAEVRAAQEREFPEQAATRLGEGGDASRDGDGTPPRASERRAARPWSDPRWRAGPFAGGSRRLRLLIGLAATAAVATVGACTGGPDNVAERGTATGEPGTGRAPSTVSSTQADSPDAVGDSTLPGSDGPPSTLAEETPQVLGRTAEPGTDYARPTTCADLRSLLGSGRIDGDATAVLPGRVGTWLAIDLATASADVLFSGDGAGRRVLKLRDGALYADDQPTDLGLPALATDVPYATARVEADLSVPTCEEAPVG